METTADTMKARGLQLDCSSLPRPCRRFTRCEIACATLAIWMLANPPFCDPYAAVRANGIESPELEIVRERLLSWTMSVSTFDMSYRLKRIFLAGDQNGSQAQWRFEYRRAGDNFYFREEEFDERGEFSGALTHACINGERQFLQNYPSGNASGIVNITKVTFPYFPWGAYITPEEILGEEMGHPMREMLSSGESLLLEKGGQLVLMHDNHELRKSVKVYFNDALNVTRMDWFVRPYDLSKEDMERLWSGDPLELRLLLNSLVFHDMTEVDGVMFPLRVEKIWWDSDKAAKERTIRRRDSGEISQAEYFVENYSRPQFESAKQTFEIESIRLNQPMSADDFRIQWPENAQLFDDDTNVPVTNPNASGDKPWHLSLWGYCIPRIDELTVFQISIAFAALSVVLAATAGIVWALRRTAPKHSARRR